MRNKALLCTAVLAAGIVSTMAQVYSLNVVGYYNVTIPSWKNVGDANEIVNKHAALIANQFVVTNYSFDALFPTGPINAQCSKYIQGQGFVGAQFDEFENKWLPEGFELRPGEGALFVNNNSGSALTITFVGEVKQGTTVSNILDGLSVISLQTPQVWTPDDPQFAFPNVINDQISKYVENKGFDGYQFDEFESKWLPEGLSIGVGEAVLVNKVGAATWTRTFNVQ